MPSLVRACRLQLAGDCAQQRANQNGNFHGFSHARHRSSARFQSGKPIRKRKIFADLHSAGYSTFSESIAADVGDRRFLQMNIHEYQAKELLQRFDVATTRGKVASTLDEAEQIARELGDVEIVVKAQIHAGGRGKGVFKNGFKGGVHVRKTPEEVREVAAKMLGQILVTHQTGPAGRVVNKVLVAQSAEIAREIYFAILLDRETAAPLIVASPEGGVEIETVAAKSPEKIIREAIDPLAGLQPFQTRKLAKQLGFDSSQLKSASKLFEGLYRTFVAFDCSMIEVNPLVVTTKGDVLALDAKFNFDDNALYRHPDIAALRDVAEEDPREVEASKHGLNYIGLDGNIACLVNGAGLAMATMDIIKFYGGEPATFSTSAAARPKNR